MLALLSNAKSYTHRCANSSSHRCANSSSHYCSDSSTHRCGGFHTCPNREPATASK